MNMVGRARPRRRGRRACKIVHVNEKTTFCSRRYLKHGVDTKVVTA